MHTAEILHVTISNSTIEHLHAIITAKIIMFQICMLTFMGKHKCSTSVHLAAEMDVTGIKLNHCNI